MGLDCRRSGMNILGPYDVCHYCGLPGARSGKRPHSAECPRERFKDTEHNSHGEDVVEIQIPPMKTAPWKHQEEAYRFAYPLRGSILALDMGPQPLTAKVLTPTGWTTMGSLCVGNTVIGGDGLATTVSRILPRGEQNVFRVTFSDGSSSECSDHHLWKVSSATMKNRGDGWRVLSLAEIRTRLHDGAGNRRWYIPMVLPIQFSGGVSLPLSPYALGVFIGDGCLTAGAVYSKPDVELAQIMQAEIGGAASVKKYTNSDTWSVTTKKGQPNPVLDALRSVGLLGKKSCERFIPKDFLLASVVDRVALLQGLADTDGHVQPGKNTVEYCTTSEKLKDDFVFLVQSLGGRCAWRKKKTNCLDAYVVHFGLPANVLPFRLARKANNFKPRTKYLPTRGFESVELIGKKEVQCIEVEADHHTYVTDDFIVTHNCGKSWVASALLSGRDHRRVLVCCPLSVVDVWPKQFALHSGRGELVVPLVGPVTKKRDTAIKAIEQAKDRPLVLVTNYDSAWREPFGSWAMSAGFDCLIHDECHRLKSSSGKASIWASRMAKIVPYRIGLSGTPYPHSPLDGYGVCRAIDSKVFGGSFVSYRNRYAVMGGWEGKQVIGWRDLDDMNKRFYSIAIRKTKEECLDLPAFQHVVVPIKLAGRAAKLYRDLETDFVAEVRSGVVTASNALVRMLRLQQMTSGYCCVDDLVERIGEEKQKALADLLEDVGPNEPFVVFCRFRHDLREIERIAGAAGRPYNEVSGDRKELESWNAAGAGAVLGVQTQSGGLGIDLTKARYVCYYSQVLSLGDYEQSLARVHRPGQTKTVTYYHLLASRTVDEKIHLALREHKSVIDEVLRKTKEEASVFEVDETILE